MTEPLDQMSKAIAGRGPKGLREGVRHADRRLQRLPRGDGLRLQRPPAPEVESVSQPGFRGEVGRARSTLHLHALLREQLPQPLALVALQLDRALAATAPPVPQAFLSSRASASRNSRLSGNPSTTVTCLPEERFSRRSFATGFSGTGSTPFARDDAQRQSSAASRTWDRRARPRSSRRRVPCGSRGGSVEQVEDRAPVGLELCGADPGNLRESGEVRGARRGERGECPIVQDHVGGNGAPGRFRSTPFAKRLDPRGIGGLRAPRPAAAALGRRENLRRPRRGARGAGGAGRVSATRASRPAITSRPARVSESVRYASSVAARRPAPSAASIQSPTAFSLSPARMPGGREGRQRIRQPLEPARQHRHDAAPAPALSAPGHAREDLAQPQKLFVGERAAPLAVSASAAGARRVALAEIAEDRRPVAAGGIRVGDHALELLQVERAASLGRRRTRPTVRSGTSASGRPRSSREACSRLAVRRALRGRSPGSRPRASRGSRNGRPPRRRAGRCPCRRRSSRRRSAGNRPRIAPGRACARPRPSRRDTPRRTRPPARSASAARSALLRVAAYTSARPAPTSSGRIRALLDLAGDPAHVEPEVRAVEPRDEDLGLREPEQRDDVARTSGVAVAVKARIGGRPAAPSARRQAAAASASMR